MYKREFCENNNCDCFHRNQCDFLILCVDLFCVDNSLHCASVSLLSEGHELSNETLHCFLRLMNMKNNSPKTEQGVRKVIEHRSRDSSRKTTNI